MNRLLKYHLYIIGFLALTAAALWINWNCPPNYDEAHAWNIARYLSPAEIFAVSKTEGHPFLWYFLLMPLAKFNFLYPYALYFLNLILILSAFYLLYKYAPFPTYIKYLITFSAPFLQLYTAFARSYSLTILLLFTALALYPKRHQKQLFYLFTLFLLANTNLIGIFLALSLGSIYLFENLQNYYSSAKQNFRPLFYTLNFALIECLFLILQFYDYDRNIPKHTPISNSLQLDITNALAPLNIYTYTVIIICSLILFIKNHAYSAFFLLTIFYTQLIILFTSIYHGAIHHHLFLYIGLIAAFWLSASNRILTKTTFLPLALVASALIFNPNIQFKLKDKAYLYQLESSAHAINRFFPQDSHQQLLVLEHFDANIILPYLNDNITLLNQTMTDFTTLKAFNESLYHMYIPINRYTIIGAINTKPDILLYRSCGRNFYQNELLTFNLKYRLNDKYCIYTINSRF